MASTIALQRLLHVPPPPRRRVRVRIDAPAGRAGRAGAMSRRFRVTRGTVPASGDEATVLECVCAVVRVWENLWTRVAPGCASRLGVSARHRLV